MTNQNRPSPTVARPLEARWWICRGESKKQGGGGKKGTASAHTTTVFSPTVALANVTATSKMAKAVIAAVGLLALAGLVAAGGMPDIQYGVEYSTNCHKYPKEYLSMKFRIIISQVTDITPGTPPTFTTTQNIKLFADADATCQGTALVELHFAGGTALAPETRTIANKLPDNANTSDVYATTMTLTARTITLNDDGLVAAFPAICVEYAADGQPTKGTPYDILVKGCATLGINNQTACPAEYDIVQTFDNGDAFLTGLRDKASEADDQPNVCDSTKAPHLLNTLFILATDPSDYPIPTDPPTTPPPTTVPPSATPTAGAAQAVPLFATAIGLAAAALQM